MVAVEVAGELPGVGGADGVREDGDLPAVALPDVVQHLLGEAAVHDDGRGAPEQGVVLLQNKQMLPSNGKGLTSKICSNPMLLTAVLCLVWSIVQYVIMKGKFLKPGSDATSVAVVLGYVFYSILYIRVMMMKEIKSITKRFVFPILALFGVSIILIGGASADPWYTVMFTLFCAIIFTLGFYYNDKNDKVPS